MAFYEKFLHFHDVIDSDLVLQTVTTTASGVDSSGEDTDCVGHSSDSTQYSH